MTTIVFTAIACLNVGFVIGCVWGVITERNACHDAMAMWLEKRGV